MEAECLEKNLSHLNFNISRKINHKKETWKNTTTKNYRTFKVSLNCPNAQIISKNGTNQPWWSFYFCNTSFDVKCGDELIGSFSVYPSHDFGHSNTISWDCPQNPKYPKAGITWPSGDLYTWVKLHFMQDVEFNTFDNFPCIHTYDLEIFGSSFPKWP